METAVPAPVPPAPRKPSPAARELIYRYAGSQGAMLWIGLSFALFGIPFVLGFSWGLWRDVAIAFTGQEVQAQVVGAALDHSKSINGKHPTTVQYVYEVAGTRFEGETDVLNPGFSEDPKGAVVQVEYARGQLGWSRIVGETSSFFGYFSLFTLIFPIVGLTFVFVAVRSNRREIRAFVHGTATMARVTFAGEDRSVTVNRRHPFVLRWEFEAEGGKWTGSLSSMDRSRLTYFAEKRGEEVVVLYTPGDPKTNTLWVE